MAEKTDEEIIKEVGLETTNDVSNEDALAALSFDNDTSNNVQLVEQNNEEEELTPISNNDVEQINNINTTTEENQNNVIENEDKDEETNKVSNENEKEISIQKKQPKIYRILMIVIALLASLLLIGLIMYLTGFFDPEEPKPMPKPKPMPEIEIKMDENIEFDEKEINTEKLNRKLTALTKTEIMNKEELEAEERRIKEEERKKKEAEQKALEEKQRLEEEKKQAQLEKIQEERRLLEEHRMAIKKEQDEFIKLQEEAQKAIKEHKNELLQQINQNQVTLEENQSNKDEEKTKQNEMQDNMKEEASQQTKEEIKMFMPFINVATIKGALFKEYLDKVQTFDKRLSLCRDSKNRIEIYFGPYDSQKERTKILNNLMDNGFKESYLVDFTKEEYEKRCKY